MLVRIASVKNLRPNSRKKSLSSFNVAQLQSPPYPISTHWKKQWDAPKEGVMLAPQDPVIARSSLPPDELFQQLPLRLSNLRRSSCHFPLVP
jgi:hypothetical protein